MRKYKEPFVEIISIDASDVITTSPGTETGIYDENDGLWDLDITQ